MNTSLNSADHPERSPSTVDTRLLGAACWIPLITVLTLIGFAAIAWTQVGHWPHYANPDPKDLRLPLLHAAALLSLPIGFVSIPACFLVVIAMWDSLKWRDIIAFTVGAALWAFILPLTRHLFEWMID